jgi:hypothetical protein
MAVTASGIVPGSNGVAGSDDVLCPAAGLTNSGAIASGAGSAHSGAAAGGASVSNSATHLDIKFDPLKLIDVSMLAG